MPNGCYKMCEWVKVEFADFESYAGCTRPEQIADFLGTYGLREWKRTPFAKHVGGERYYDVMLFISVKTD